MKRLNQILHIVIFICLLLGCDTLPKPNNPQNQNEYTFLGGVRTQSGNPVGLNQNTLIIYVRASDDNTSNLATLRTNEQNEFTDVNNFFLESSFNQLSFNYEML